LILAWTSILIALAILSYATVATAHTLTHLEKRPTQIERLSNNFNGKLQGKTQDFR